MKANVIKIYLKLINELNYLLHKNDNLCNLLVREVRNEKLGFESKKAKLGGKNSLSSPPKRFSPTLRREDCADEAWGRDSLLKHLRWSGYVCREM